MPPRRKIFDKNTSTTFALVHRAQNDPLIHDENAPSMVFAEKAARRQIDNDDNALPTSSAASAMSGASGFSTFSRRGKQRGDLEEEFGTNFRPNEGEAAQHGVYYDDTKYNYMQHMKDLGSGDGPVAWIEAKPAKVEKGKQKLEDALRDMEIGSNAGSSYAGSSYGGGVAQSVGQSSMASSVARSLLPEDVLPSEFVTRRTYQDQQDIPDAIAGFQPDMDPRLRETLEALDDEAYVDDEDDFFGDLVQGGREIDQDEWERLGEQQMFEVGEGELDDGWESDDTIKAGSPPPQLNIPQPADGELIEPPKDTQAVLPADPTEGAWLDEFKKFKHEAKTNEAAGRPVKASPSAFDQSLISSLASRPGKKRKGAKTNASNYSMSSSALVRTDQQNLLDDRFDKLEESYTIAEEFGDFGDDEGMNDNMSSASGMTGMSKASRMSKYSQMSGLSGVSGMSSYSRATDSEAPMLQRSDFDSIMDDFLGGHKISGKASKKLQRFGPQTGMEQLDEVRSQLGKARRTGRAATGAAR
jgi:protein LTV1